MRKTGALEESRDAFNTLSASMSHEELKEVHSPSNTAHLWQTIMCALAYSDASPHPPLCRAVIIASNALALLALKDGEPFFHELIGAFKRRILMRITLGESLTAVHIGVRLQTRYGTLP